MNGTPYPDIPKHPFYRVIFCEATRCQQQCRHKLEYQNYTYNRDTHEYIVSYWRTCVECVKRCPEGHNKQMETASAKDWNAIVELVGEQF